MKILVADPAKNITVFVLEPVEGRGERTVMAQTIMADDRIRAEQVGFVIPPAKSASGTELWRLEMAGDEFCCNASRSFGLYVAGMKGLRGRNKIFVSVSGMENPVQVEVDTENGWAACEMPRPALVETLNYNGFLLPVLGFDGITHIIAPDLEPARESFFIIKALLEKKFSGITGSPFSAIGVMFYDTFSRFMRPAVYLRATDALVFESSCGSGSAALGAWLSRELQDGVAKYAINQPGGVIETEVVKKAGEISFISIGGKVEFGKPEEFFFARPIP